MKEGFYLDDVEIVAGSYSLEAVTLEVVGGGEGISYVEREIATAAIGGEVGEVVVIAHEVAVSVA